MPLDHVAYALDLWRKQSYDRILGFGDLGRAHFLDGDGHLRYSLDTRRGVSIVLPSGCVFDRHFLDMYTQDMGKLGLLDYVNSIMNCEDILFNFVIANDTGAGPAVVNYHASVLEMGNKGGLWTRGSHKVARDECIQHFATFFGGVPLRYFGLLEGISREQELSKSGGLHDVPMADDLWWSREPI